ncbi:MAG TPA: hypothetical protein VNH84_13115, partial [Candidatus Saccharimonadales bacterium]|nr:hypothetical protein [Candidatus Saccharimonadales bacterium]
GELTEFLRRAAARFDLIASADTLVYFGDLRPVLHAARDALRPNGVLTFTVERWEEATGQGFRLHSWGRYSHAEEYLRAELAEAGLGLCRLHGADLRMELGQPVAGWVVTARRSGD